MPDRGGWWPPRHCAERLVVGDRLLVKGRGFVGVAGEVLVSADLLSGCERTFPVAGERTLELKGITKPLAAALVAWSEESGAQAKG